MLARLLFLLLIWIAGLVAHEVDGLLSSYIWNLQIYQALFSSGFIVLLGSYMMQRSLHSTILSFRPLLKMDESLFHNFSERLERYSYSFLPCLLVALLFTGLWSGVPLEFQRMLVEGFSLHVIWFLSFAFFVNLLLATGIWFGVSIWLTVFLISRQPLKVEPSARTVEEFRGLALLALWFSLFYFLGVSIGIMITFLGSPGVSLLEFIMSPFTFFIALGMVSVLFPFYSIHRTLATLKKQELVKIGVELGRLGERLEDVLKSKLTDEVVMVVGHLFSLQLRRERVEAAQEWPIDITFLAKFSAVVLIPVIGRILLEILDRFF